jgi:hypothetical protein
MPKPVHKLSVPEVTEKVGRLINKLRQSRVPLITSYEESLLRTLLGQYVNTLARIETTEQWAREAYKSNERLMELIKERWQAGWTGNKDKEESETNERL